MSRHGQKPRRRSMLFQQEFHYIGLGNDFWSCYHCKNTCNQNRETHCSICKNKRDSKPSPHWSDFKKEDECN